MLEENKDLKYEAAKQQFLGLADVSKWNDITDVVVQLERIAIALGVKAGFYN